MNKLKYRWGEGRSRFKVKAQVAGERIELLRTKNGGSITPATVVKDAKSKSSPLHNAFEWNNAKAADAHRLFQARNLIASIEVVYEEAESVGPVRAFVSVRAESGENFDYQSTREAMTVPEMREMVLSRALREAHEWMRRYKDYKELAKIFKAISDAS